jgi:hypothetical protein
MLTGKEGVTQSFVIRIRREASAVVLSIMGTLGLTRDELREVL